MRLPAPADWRVWSARRQNEFEECPRCSWLSFCAAPAGVLPDAEPRLRQVFYHSRVVPRGVWLNLLVRRVMRELFYREETGREPLSGEALANALKRAFLRSWLELWDFLTEHPAEQLGAAVPWPLMIPLIPEEAIDPGAPDPETLRREIETELTTHAHLLGGAAWLILDTIPAADRIAVSVPVTVAVNHLSALTSPLAAFRRGVELWIVDGAEHRFDEGMTVLLHKFFAANRFGMLPHFVRSLRIDPRSGELRELLPELNVSAELKRLDLLTRTLADGVDADGGCCCDAFPMREEHCGVCRYRTVCPAFA